MMVGIASTFAIESGINQFFKTRSFRALGFFVLHIQGVRYGVFEPDATLMAVSFNEVGRRIARRGSHRNPFPANASALEVADSVYRAIYDDIPDDTVFLGLDLAEIRRLVAVTNILWAPDGDEAFDDGSFVLQFDVGDQVRLIGFKPTTSSAWDDTLREVWMSEEDFYSTLRKWHVAFEIEWERETRDLVES